MSDVADEEIPLDECLFCSEPLTAEDVALYETARTAWVALAERSPETAGAEPNAICRECREEIEINSHALTAQRVEADRPHAKHAASALFIVIMVSFSLLVLVLVIAAIL